MSVGQTAGLSAAAGFGAGQPSFLDDVAAADRFLAHLCLEDLIASHLPFLCVVVSFICLVREQRLLNITTPGTVE